MKLSFFKGLFTIAFVSLFFPSSFAQTAKPYLPENIQDGLILHCFNWKLNDITAELDNIAASGFNAIQTSPMQGPVHEGQPWYYTYQVGDYRWCDSYLGTREDMIRLCEEARKRGVKIVVDIEANGVMPGMTDQFWEHEGHVHPYFPIDWSSRYGVTYGVNIGGYDCATDNPEVQQRAREFLADLKSMGVAGLRWDSARHIGLPSEGDAFFAEVLRDCGMWSYAELLWYVNDDPNVVREYASLLSIVDQNSWWDLEHKEQNWFDIPRERMVGWGESHDTFANNQTDTQTQTQDEIDRRWAVVAARKGSSGLYLSRPGLLPKDDIKVGDKGSTHFKEQVVKWLNIFHNVMGAEAEETYSAGDLRAVYRHLGLVVVKPGGGAISIPVKNLDVSRIYADAITGSRFSLAKGYISGTIDPVTGIGVIFDYENHVEASPSIIARPNSTAFRDETTEILLRTTHAQTARYRVNNGDWTEFTDECRFSVGESVAAPAEFVIEWEASRDKLTNGGQFSVKKLSPEADTYVYLNYDDGSAWDRLDFYTYIYSEAGSNANWPGVKMDAPSAMTVNEHAGPWRKYKVPAIYADDGRAIVSSTGTFRYPANMEPGILLNGESIAFTHHAGVWQAIPVRSQTDIDNLSGKCDAALRAWNPAPGKLVIDSGDELATVYNMQGAKIAHCDAPISSLYLQSGIYIVTTGAQTLKIIVK